MRAGTLIEACGVTAGIAAPHTRDLRRPVLLPRMLQALLPGAQQRTSC
jgi:hypothetical protein